MEIIQNTTFTPYNKDTRIKPVHPVWILKNTGFIDAKINESIILFPGDHFGVDCLPLLIPVIQSHMKEGGEKITITNDTEFSVSFGDPAAYGTSFFPQVTLIETSFTIKKG